jgi:UDPglucose 6-dehydrogenase
MNIGFIGLGKLGLPCAVAISAKGHNVNGYDINPNITSKTHPKDILYTQETDEFNKNTIQPMLESSKLKIIDTIEEIVENSEIIFVAIQTPHQSCYEGHVPIPNERADFNYEYLINCIKNLSIILDKMNIKRIVTIISTVLPGTLRKYIFPVLSKNIKLCYNPYFIAMGSVVYDFYNPEFILLGHIDDDAEYRMREFYKTITDAEVFSTTLENAEMIKVSYNTYITTKIVMANNIMEMCHKLPNTNVDVVMSALKKGSRRLTSSAYLSGGMGDGGGCHPRDNIAMSWLSNKLNIESNYYDFIMNKREKQTEFLANLIIETHNKTSLPICILGTAFKPNTNIETGSPAILLKNILINKGYKVETYDPNINTILLNNIFQCENKIYFIGCKHDIFETYKFNDYCYVIDPHRYIKEENCKNINYVGIGNKI